MQPSTRNAPRCDSDAAHDFMQFLHQVSGVMENLLLPVHGLSIQFDQQCFTDLLTEVGDGHIEFFVSVHDHLDLELHEGQRREQKLLSDS